MAQTMPTLALTAGEPAGIGPDLCVMLAQTEIDYRLVIIADPQILIERAAVLGLPFDYKPWPDDGGPTAGVYVLAINASAAVEPGILNPANADYVIKTLARAVDGCLAREFDALVTGPVHKGVINDAGIDFSGHTEYLAAKSQSRQVVMMLTAGSLRVALATTHLPLKAISKAITHDYLTRIIEILHSELIEKFGIDRPHIAVCGLNPHAGEGGYFGKEEIETIIPVLQSLRAKGMQLIGPVAADTAFTPERLRGIDAVLAMYHDQGLPVLKFAGFGQGLNITLGLPFIRTSVDHGTALTRSGTGEIETGSLQTAINQALAMIQQ